MAIVSVNILKQGGGDDSDRVTTFTDEYEVITDDCDDRITSLSDILLADDGTESIPQIHATHRDNNLAFCVGRTAEQNDFVWTVRCTYTNETTDTPLRAPAELRWDAREYKRPITVDVSTPPVAVITTAGARFDPTPEVDDADMTLVIVRNEASFDPVEKMAFRYTLPTASFYGFAAVQCRMRPITAQRVLEPFRYWKVTYTIDFCNRTDESGNQKGWTIRVLNAGTIELVGGAQTNSPGGQPNNQPILLAANGTRLAYGSDPVYREFNGYRSVSWASLNLEGA